MYIIEFTRQTFCCHFFSFFFFFWNESYEFVSKSSRKKALGHWIPLGPMKHKKPRVFASDRDLFCSASVDHKRRPAFSKAAALRLNPIKKKQKKKHPASHPHMNAIL